MKRLITLLLLTVFSVLIFTVPINAAQWDPNVGPNWVDQRYAERADVSTDGDPWVDVEKSNSLGFNDYFNFRLFFILIIPIQVDFEVDITAGDDAENSGGDINSSRNTAGQ
ncbi:MAG: hypothetical protein ACT6FE_03810 [Methanosarcinaceae archaeon]